MIVASYVSNKSNMNDTKTYEDYYKFLGAKPHRLGVMSRMYPYLTASFITEGIGNIFHMDSKREKFKYWLADHKLFFLIKLMQK